VQAVVIEGEVKSRENREETNAILLGMVDEMHEHEKAKKD